jgi:uncharacterized lipoprotein NlpE involved in copper resistance
MKILLKLNSVLILSASFFLAGCLNENMRENMIETEAVVTMRNFDQADVASAQLGSGEIKSISNEVSDNLKSSIFKMENGQMVTCNDCNIDDFEVTQVFLCNNLSDCDFETLTLLYQNGATTNATYTFTGDVIGIDMNYNGEYVRMSDIGVFNQSQDGEYSYAGELGVEVFANDTTGTNSAVYNFPILSDEDDPENSLSGMWMRIVLDFN